MRFAVCVLSLTVCSYFSAAEECKHVRHETASEAKRRAVFERCLVSCSESPREPNPCHRCVIPYKGYGCLLKKEELIGCETDCELHSVGELPFKRCLQRCEAKRRALKKLRKINQKMKSV